ncbi:hypothetical protein [Parachitinimonas caeni]|uniref:Lipoprotein n=1 Tax=Parachitinimonas caeni TaxID=3031301 RepID=A0ABT7DYZ5_9NEIS|nr:hypothetical protein [Parachitinimonas caeni]MDK2125283.1 hypothetical protein [Parachitinimonas caeni]
MRRGHWLWMGLVMSGITTGTLASYDIRNWQDASREAVAAWKVVDKQEAVMADKVAATVKAGSDGQATGVVSISVNRRILDKVRDFGRFAGQPLATSCDTLQRDRYWARSLAAMVDATADSTLALASRGGLDLLELSKSQMDQHKRLYCSVAEAQAHACELVPTALQGGDADYGAWAAPLVLDRPGMAAGMDYVQQVASLRSTPESACKQEECKAIKLEDLSRNAANALVGHVLLEQLKQRGAGDDE